MTSLAGLCACVTYLAVTLGTATPPAVDCDPLVGTSEGCLPSPSVHTKHGPVVGFIRQNTDTSGVSVSTYWGIPFADPPRGLNRLRAPQPITGSWSTPLQATKRSAICPQWTGAQNEYDTKPNSEAEDCLYLNVYAPTAAVGSRRLLPVMVWIYGGAYTFGDAYTTILGKSAFDGAALAGRHDVLVVTFNYRLDGLGFFASEALRAEDPEGSTGNVALRDQRAALEWVQANIAGFGGDPKRVTLFGESAGGFSVMWHLVSRPSWSLFQQAIMESGTSKLSWFFQPYEGHSREFYAQWSEKINCPRDGPAQLQCLRKVDYSLLKKPPAGITVASPAYDVSMKHGSLPFGPSIDGTVAGLEGVPLELVQAGHFNKVPLVLGANKDGGTIFRTAVQQIVPGMHVGRVRNKNELRAGLLWAFNKTGTASIEAVYPDSEFRKCLWRIDYTEMLNRILRDASFQCSNRAVAMGLIAHAVPVFLYTFSFNLGFLDHLSGLGDMHAAEIIFIFRHFLWIPSILAGRDTIEMSDLMSCMWTTFAHTGTPNGLGPDSLPPNCGDVQPRYAAWPAFDGTGRRYYSLRMPPRVAALRPANRWPDDEFPSDLRCDMWDGHDFPWHSAGAVRAGNTAPVVVV